MYVRVASGSPQTETASVEQVVAVSLKKLQGETLQNSTSSAVAVDKAGKGDGKVDRGHPSVVNQTSTPVLPSQVTS